MEDVTKTGPVGLKGLPPLSRQQQQEFLNAITRPSGKNVNATSNMYSSPDIENVGEELGRLGYGQSQYDEDIQSLYQAENINEFRAQDQPWYDQIANGALKMVTTAGTTFLDGTLGTIWGLGTGIANMFDDDPKTGFWRGMWDNAVSNAMADINEAMEENFKNYRTEWEQNASVFDRMFSGIGAANFWGDDILKNAGFTIGAAGAIAATSGAGSLLKGVGWLGKLAKGLRLAQAGTEGLEATKAGKFASWLGKTFISTQGEAAIEAVNAMRDNRKDMENNLSLRRQDLVANAEARYQDMLDSGIDPQLAKIAYDSEIAKIDNDIDRYRNQMESEFQDAGNMVYAANIATLALSNNLTLGSMIRGGYGNAKSLLEQTIKTSAGKPISTAKEAGKALLKGDLRFDAPAVKGAMPKALGHWALTSTQEGVEEGVQNLISNTEQMQTQAKMNQWAKGNTMLGSMINPNAEEDLVSFGNALSKAYQDQFGAINSPGWTEFMAGVISGALGVGSVHRNAEGKIRPTWQGGIKESWETVTGNRKAIQRQADTMNKILQDNKFGERAKHAVEQLSIKRGQDAALDRGDVRAYKNFEVQQLLSDALFFRDMGMLDDYLEMYQALSDGVTDQDVAELRAMVKSEDGTTSHLDKMTDDDIKSLYKDKASRTLEKIKKSLDDFDAIDRQYGGKFSDTTRREALMEMSFLNTIYWDMQRRNQNIQEEIDDLESKDSLSPIEKETLQQKKEAVKAITESATDVQKVLNEYKNNPSKLQKRVEAQQTRRQKENLYKKAEEAIKKYKESNTLQDIVDVYAHSPEEDREAVLTQAIEQSEGETKAKLEQFKNYLGDVSTLEELIKSTFPVESGADVLKNVQYRHIFQTMLNNAVNEMLEDENPVLSRETLKEKLDNRLSEFKEELAAKREEHRGLKLADNGNYDFQEALEEGVVTPEDFEEILDDPLSEDTHLEIKKGSNAESMANALNYAESLEEMVGHLEKLVDSLSKLDELRKAGKKPKEKSEPKTAKKKKEKEEKSGKAKKFPRRKAEDTEEPEEQGDLKPDDLLTSEEAKSFHVEVEEGTLGIKYNKVVRDKKDDKAANSIIKRLEKTDRKIEIIITNFEASKNKERKQKAIKSLFDLVKSNLVTEEIIEDVEKFLKGNIENIKPVVEAGSSAAEHSNEKGQSSDGENVSLNGNQFPAYVGSELDGEKKKMVAVTRQASGITPVQVWLHDNNIKIQEVIDNYLGKIISKDSKKSAEDKTPIHYLHNIDQDNILFLGIEYSKVESIIPRDRCTVVEGHDGKSYVLVGTLGWESSRAGTKDMFDSLLAETKSERQEGVTDEWVVNTKHTNRIKDISGGATVKQTLSDDEPHVRDLSELLVPTRNPYGLSIDDLGWVVVEGTEEKPTMKPVNTDLSNVYKIKGGRPGQVYILIPASNGKMIPIYMEAVFYQELEDDNILSKEIDRLLAILADTEVTTQDKKSAIGQLNDLLIFSRPNQIHYNDEASKYDANTIYITRNGIPVKVIDFDEGTGSLQDLKEAVKSINPRVNLSTTNLERNPQLYLESGVLRTDIALLGTVNSKFFLYPIDSDNDWVENKPHKATKVDYSPTIKERVYLDGKYVYYDGSKFTDEKGRTVEDSDGTLKAAYTVKQGKYKAITYKNGTYYEVGNEIYVDNGHGGLSLVDDILKKEVLASKEGKDKKEKRKKKLSEIKGKEKAQTSSTVLPSYFSSMKSQLGDKTSKWDYYTEDDSNTKDTKDGVLIIGASWQSTILPSLRLAVDAGVLGKEYEIPIDTKPNVKDSEKAREAIKQLKRLGIRKPSDLITYIEEKSQQRQTSTSQNHLLDDFIQRNGQGSIMFYPKGSQVNSVNLRDHINAYRTALNLIKWFKSADTEETLHDLLTSNNSLTVNDLTWIYKFFNLYKQGKLTDYDVSKLVIPESYREDRLDIQFNLNPQNAQQEQDRQQQNQASNNDILEQMKEVLIQETIKLYDELGAPLSAESIANMRSMSYTDNAISGYGREALKDPDIRAKVNAVKTSRPSRGQDSNQTASNFTNGTDINRIKSEEELQRGRIDDTLLNRLRQRENKEKVRTLRTLIKNKFKRNVSSNAEILDTLKEKGIDLSSNDLDTIIDIVEHCR